MLLTFVAALVAACGGGSNTATTDDMKGTITVAYSTTYVFDSDDQSVIWWDKVKKEFEQQYPNAKLNLQGFNGTDVDLVNKVALEYKNPSTTPDVFMLPTGYVGQWVGSDYLLPLDSFVNDSSKAPFWASFPKVIQDESKINGKVYAVNTGENNSALYYNTSMLQKAGVTVPWQPKNWDDLLAAARAVKASGQKVVAFWAPAGTSAGAGGVLQGSANMVYASSSPTIYDYDKKKWVVDSPGLREVMRRTTRWRSPLVRTGSPTRGPSRTGTGRRLPRRLAPCRSRPPRGRHPAPRARSADGRWRSPR